MLGNAVKLLYYFLFVLSCFGMILLFVRRRKYGVAVAAIIAVDLLWRELSAYKSFRYYSILLVFGVALSSYAVYIVISRIKYPYIRKTFASILVLTLLLVQTFKAFGSFVGFHILDACDSITMKHKINEGAFFCIYEKDFNRLSNGLGIDESHAIAISPVKSYEDFRDISINNNCFSADVYFLIHEKKNAPISSCDHFFYDKGELHLTKVEHLFSNARQNAFVSVYKLDSFTPAPDIDIHPFLTDSELKAYVPEYDAFIYQDHNKIKWLIGADIDSDTEIIYHLYTTDRQLLPAKRIQYGFDNRGFRLNNKSQKKQEGKYIFVEKDLPVEYPVTAVRTGFNTKEDVVWRRFIVSKQE